MLLLLSIFVLFQVAYKYLKILNMHFIDEKWSKIFSLVSWGIFLLSEFYKKHLKVSAIG